MVVETKTAPLVVAAMSMALGGVGNVAFSAHSGSQLGLLAARFAFGVVLATVWLQWRKPPKPSIREVRHPGLVLHWVGVFEALAVVCLMLSADYVDTLVFTALGICGPALVALGAKFLRLPQPTRLALMFATICVIAAGLSVFSAEGGGRVTTGVGVALAIGSTLFGVVAMLLTVYAASVHHPVTVVKTTCGWGLVVVGVLVLLGGALDVTTSTVLVALFIAVGPGGIAKAGVAWSAARTSPALVSSLVGVAVPVAAVGGWLFLGETPTTEQLIWAGIATLAVSGLMATRRQVTTNAR